MALTSSLAPKIIWKEHVAPEFRLAEQILTKTIKDLEDAKLLLAKLSEIDRTTYYGGQHEIIRDMLPTLKEWLEQAKTTI